MISNGSLTIERVDYVYDDGINEHSVWVIISDLDFFKNSFILDIPSSFNHGILPTDEKIVNTLIDDWNKGLLDKIKIYCYIEDKSDKVWCDLIQLERNRRLGLLV